MRVDLASITFDAGTQIRHAINEDVVAEYAERMTEGVIFPPVVLFHDGNHYYMADGFHRTLAAQRNDFLDIEADVRPGTKTDALWFALGANRTNGQRLSPSDKRHAIMLALQAWPEKSNVMIAEQIGCTDMYVGMIRSQVPTTLIVARVTGKDGRNYPATKDGDAPNPKREAIAGLFRAGMRSGEIRRELHVHPTLIADVRRELGMAPERTPDNPDPQVPAATREQRLDRMRTMAAEGYSSRQIAADVKLSDDRCRELMKRAGIDVPADRAIGKTKRHDSTRIIERIVADAENLTEATNLIVFAEIDRAQLPAWLDSLQDSREKLGTFIRRLMKERQTHGEAA